ncbi:MAG: FtsQ-type POTRA domain-containing protein [Erysipelotrichaceae bacterium]
MKQGKDVVSVDDLIANRKKEKRQRRLRKFLIGTAFFLFTSAVCAGYYLYFASTSALSSSILISGTKILPDAYILKLSDSGYTKNFLMQNAALLRKNIKVEPLVQDAVVSLDANNVIRIQVTEKPIMAIWLDEAKLVLSDGSLLPLKDEYAKAWLQNPGIYGYKDVKTLQPLVNAMKPISKEGLGNVSEIHLYPTRYDENFVKVIMQDGNRIFTSLTTLDMIEEYPRIVNALKADNSCIFFDEMTRTAFSQPCEK